METEWKDETNEETIAKVLRGLESIWCLPQEDWRQVIWAAPLPVAGNSTGASVTCKQSIINVLVILSRNNMSFSRCDI